MLEHPVHGEAPHLLVISLAAVEFLEVFAEPRALQQTARLRAPWVQVDSRPQCLRSSRPLCPDPRAGTGVLVGGVLGFGFRVGSLGEDQMGYGDPVVLVVRFDAIIHSRGRDAPTTNGRRASGGALSKPVPLITKGDPMRIRSVRRTRLLPILVAVALGALFFPITGATSAPPGNNGTIKIDGMPFDTHPNNEPHPTCVFQVDFYNYEQGDFFAKVRFTAQPPTGKDVLLDNDMVFIGEDPAGGGTDLDAEGPMTCRCTSSRTWPTPSRVSTSR